MQRKQKPKENMSSDSLTLVPLCFTGDSVNCWSQEGGEIPEVLLTPPWSISLNCLRDTGSNSEQHYKYSHDHFINKKQLLAKQLGVFKDNFFISCLFSPMAQLRNS